MSYNDDNPEELKKAGKKYLWFGYGSYSEFPEINPINPGSMRSDPSIFERLFELFGIKEKGKVDPEKDRK